MYFCNDLQVFVVDFRTKNSETVDSTTLQMQCNAINKKIKALMDRIIPALCLFLPSIH